MSACSPVGIKGFWQSIVTMVSCCSKWWRIHLIIKKPTILNLIVGLNSVYKNLIYIISIRKGVNYPRNFRMPIMFCPKSKCCILVPIIQSAGEKYTNNTYLCQGIFIQIITSFTLQCLRYGIIYFLIHTYHLQEANRQNIQN